MLTPEMQLLLLQYTRSTSTRVLVPAALVLEYQVLVPGMTYLVQVLVLYQSISTSLEFRNNRFWHNFSFVFMTWSFAILRKNSIDFFLQFSSIYLSISKLLQFSLNFFNLLQFTSCSKFLSPIFLFFLTSHSCLTFNFVEKNLMNGSHPLQPTSSTVPPWTFSRYDVRALQVSKDHFGPCKTYFKSLSPIFSKFLQSSPICFLLFFSFSNISPFFLRSFYFLLFSSNCVSVSRESSARTFPVGAILG